MALAACCETLALGHAVKMAAVGAPRPHCSEKVRLSPTDVAFLRMLYCLAGAHGVFQHLVASISSAVRFLAEPPGGWTEASGRFHP